MKCYQGVPPANKQIYEFPAWLVFDLLTDNKIILYSIYFNIVSIDKKYKIFNSNDSIKIFGLQK